VVGAGVHLRTETELVRDLAVGIALVPQENEGALGGGQVLEHIESTGLPVVGRGRAGGSGLGIPERFLGAIPDPAGAAQSAPPESETRPKVAS
jgi:hypothetical protein